MSVIPAIGARFPLLIHRRQHVARHRRNFRTPSTDQESALAPLLALISAIAYGSGDFLGGLAARRLPVVAVVWRTHVIGLAGLAVAALIVPFESVVTRDVVLGGAGGIAGGFGILLLYMGLTRGAMSVVAPITAVLSAVVPIGVGLLSGERPSALAMGGVVLALVAIGLVAREPGHVRIEGGLLVIALGAGVGFGLFFVALDASGDGAGLWPIVAGRSASAAMFVAAALTVPAHRVGARITDPALRWGLVGCGALDAAANAFFLLATQTGLLTLVSTLGALYPASTIVLARIVLKERLSAAQMAGCGLAICAAAMVSIG